MMILHWWLGVIWYAILMAVPAFLGDCLGSPRRLHKAGFKLLPADKGPTKFTAIQTIMYSFLMIPIGMVPLFYWINRNNQFMDRIGL
jgi:protoheme IX farnesyltransferase